MVEEELIRALGSVFLKQGLLLALLGFKRVYLRITLIQFDTLEVVNFVTVETQNELRIDGLVVTRIKGKSVVVLLVRDIVNA